MAGAAAEDNRFDWGSQAALKRWEQTCREGFSLSKPGASLEPGDLVFRIPIV